MESSGEFEVVLHSGGKWLGKFPRSDDVIQEQEYVGNQIEERVLKLPASNYLTSVVLMDHVRKKLGFSSEVKFFLYYPRKMAIMDDPERDVPLTLLERHNGDHRDFQEFKEWVDQHLAENKPVNLYVQLGGLY